MKKLLLFALVAIMMTLSARAQELVKVYDESVDVNEQIDKALAQARTQGKFVVCQVGGNWCPWCLKFAAFIKEDAEISQLIEDSFVYIHVNYNPRKKASDKEKAAAEKMMKRLGNPGRFGYPVFVVLDAKGRCLHIQDSSYLEEGGGYNKEKVLRFFKNWTPAALKQ